MNKLISTLIGSTVLASGTVFLSNVQVQAAGFTAATCSTSDLSGAVACEGGFSGNDGTPITAFGSDWFRADKTDEGSTIPGAIITADVNDPTGDWSVILPTTGFYATNQFVVAVKAANFYSLYLFNPSTTGGTFTTAGVAIKNGKGPDLSHMTLYVTNDERPGNEGAVPEPFTILGAATAIGFGVKFKKGLAKNKKDQA